MYKTKEIKMKVIMIILVAFAVSLMAAGTNITQFAPNGHAMFVEGTIEYIEVGNDLLTYNGSRAWRDVSIIKLKNDAVVYDNTNDGNMYPKPETSKLEAASQSSRCFYFVRAHKDIQAVAMQANASGRKVRIRLGYATTTPESYGLNIIKSIIVLGD